MSPRLSTVLLALQCLVAALPAFAEAAAPLKPHLVFMLADGESGRCPTAAAAAATTALPPLPLPLSCRCHAAGCWLLLPLLVAGSADRPAAVAPQTSGGTTSGSITTLRSNLLR
jgi:hypothetical protein